MYVLAAQQPEKEMKEWLHTGSGRIFTVVALVFIGVAIYNHPEKSGQLVHDLVVGAFHFVEQILEFFGKVIGSDSNGGGR